MTSATAVKPARTRLDSLTGLRFFAAFGVVMFHTLSNGNGTGHWRVPGTGLIATAGFVGVTFFFVLSGFVLTWSWEPGLAKRYFYGRRFARIYPLYLVAWIAALLLLRNNGHVPNGSEMAASLLLIQSWLMSPHFVYAVSPVFWTLSCELFFYAMLPFVAPRLVRFKERSLLLVAGGCVAWLVVGAFLAAVGMKQGTAAKISVFPPYRFGEFLLGVVAALLVKRGWRSPGGRPVALVLVVVTYLAGGELVTKLAHHHETNWTQFAANLLLVVPITMLIASYAVGDAEGERSWASVRPLVKLGEWSFALYLFHRTIVGMLQNQFAGGVHGTLGTTARWGFVVLVCIAVSAVAHEAIERPVEKWLRRRIGHPTETHPT